MLTEDVDDQIEISFMTVTGNESHKSVLLVSIHLSRFRLLGIPQAVSLLWQHFLRQGIVAKSKIILIDKVPYRTQEEFKPGRANVWWSNTILSRFQTKKKIIISDLLWRVLLYEAKSGYFVFLNIILTLYRKG